MPQKKQRKESARALLAFVRKEMARPRVAQSVQQRVASLAAAKAHPVVTSATTSTVIESPSDGRATRCSVLLADDSDVMRLVISRRLQEEPLIDIVGEAKNFAQMIQMAEELKPHAVVMDLHMPDENKFKPEFIKSKLLSLVQRIIVISVWNDEESIALAKSYGAAHILYKPKLDDSLVPAILKLC